MKKLIISLVTVLAVTSLGMAQPAIDIDITPSAITVPAEGGFFDFTVSIANTTGEEVTFNAWMNATTPWGFEIELVLPIEITLPGGYEASADLWLYMPWFAPSGDYTVTAYVGDYPGTIIDQASLTVTKEGADGSWSSLEGIRVAGSLNPETILPLTTSAPEEFAVKGVRPNPFNPATTISFELPEASEVQLAVYDMNGRLVASLMNGWQAAGAHQVTFDGSNLASGVYIYTLQAGHYRAAGKLVLMK